MNPRPTERKTVEELAEQLEVVYREEDPPPTEEELAARFGCSKSDVTNARKALRHKRGVALPRGRRTSPPSVELAYRIRLEYGGHTLPSLTRLSNESGCGRDTVEEAVEELRRCGALSQDDVVVELDEPVYMTVAKRLKDDVKGVPTGTRLDRHAVLALRYGVLEEDITYALLVAAAQGWVELHAKGSPTVWAGPGAKPAPETLTEQVFQELRGYLADKTQFPPGASMPKIGELEARFGVDRQTIRRAEIMLEGVGLIQLQLGRERPRIL